MDKEKIIAALIKFYDGTGMPVHDSYNDDQLEQLCNDIRNDKFNKQPCLWCSTSTKLDNYCSACGRKIIK